MYQPKGNLIYIIPFVFREESRPQLIHTDEIVNKITNESVYKPLLQPRVES